ncbi:MAG: Cell division protein FtsA, partial [uncultured bacterium]
MAKQKEEVFVALDIGTSKVCAMAGLKIPGKPLEIIGVGNASSKGIKKGIVCDIESTSEAIIAAVEECEEMADIEVNSVFVNVSGNHVKGFNNAGTAPIVNEHYEITKEDADKAISAAKAISIPMDKHVMHVISQEFTI